MAENVRLSEIQHYLANASRQQAQAQMQHTEAQNHKPTWSQMIASRIGNAVRNPVDHMKSSLLNFGEQYLPSEEDRAKQRLAMQGSVMGDWQPAMEKTMQLFGAAPMVAATKSAKPLAEVIDEAAEYRGLHQAPLKDSGAPLHDLTGGGTVYPDDVYGPNAARYYGAGEEIDDVNLFRKIHSFRNNPDKKVDIWRAVPKEAFADGKQPPFRHGDWVTISRKYAKEHGESALGGNYKLMRGTVPAKALFTNGDSPYEWGLDRSMLDKYLEGE